MVGLSIRKAYGPKRNGRVFVGCCLSFAALLLMGCEHHFFKAAGTVSAMGGELGDWVAAPEGCARDPLDGRAIGQTTTVATFLWSDPRMRDRLRDEHKNTQPNAPLRLELSRDGKGLSGRLDTIYLETPVTLDAHVCKTLTLDTNDGPPVINHGKATLRGTLKLDCRVNDSQIRADVRFSGCEY